MYRTLLVLITSLVTAGIAFTSSVNAGVCVKHTELVSTLAAKYGEDKQAIGLISKTRMLEVFASKAGTWTVVVTNPKGVSCIMATGKSFEQLSTKVAGSGV